MPRLRWLEHPGRDGRARARRRPSVAVARGRRRRRPRRRPWPTSGEADVPRLPVGHRRARPRARRRARPGIARPARRRAGDRQVHAPPPGRGRDRGGRCRVLTPRARSRPARSGCAPRGSACSTAPAGDAIEVLAEHDVGRIVEVGRAMRPPAVVVVDSIQTATVDELDGAAGSVGQVRESTLRLMELAKGEGIAVVLVGHVTKDGSIAGPEDARAPGRCGRRPRGRALRGAAPRPGDEEPLRVDRRGRRVRDGRRRPARGRRSGARLPRRACRAGAPGSVVAPTMEGSRPLLVEVQALVAPAGYGTPARKASGHRPEPARRCSSPSSAGGPASALGSHDVYANLAGGLSVAEPGLDLPLALALASSLRDGPIAAGDGRDRRGRAARRAARRRRAWSDGCARRPGSASRSAIVPRPARGAAPIEVPGLRIIEVATLREAIDGGARGRAAASWRGRPGDARLTARAGRARFGGRRATRGSR